MESFEEEILAEFLVEANELLARLDQELVELEATPSASLVGSVFRSVHTIKGSAGFLGLESIESLAHDAETLLARVRDGVLELSPAIIDALLAAVDGVRDMVTALESGGQDSPRDFTDLRVTLVTLASGESPDSAPTDAADVAAAAPAVSAPVTAPDVDPVEEFAAWDHDGDLPAVQPATVTEPAVGVDPVEPVKVEAPHPQATVSADRGGIFPRPAPADGPAEPVDTSRTSGGDHETIRVDVAVLDELMNLVGELVLTRNQMRALLAGSDSQTQTALGRLSLLTGELQASVMKTRMQPIQNLFGKYPRVVRDLAANLGKQVSLEISGGETELDRTLIEAFKDPFLHLVRNAVDHGLESPEQRIVVGKPAEGLLRLSARHASGQVRVEITDDGAGLNLQAIRVKAIQKGLIDPKASLTDDDIANLIFVPGFSTAEKVTAVSGRGVGMDVVKTHIERIGGSLSVATRAGEGTTITATIPLTLAIMPSLIVVSDGWRYALPQSAVEELVLIEPGDLQQVGGAMVLRLRDQLLPVVSLGKVLATSDEHALSVVVVREGQLRFGLLVDAAPGAEEVVVKPVDALLQGVEVYAGATIMGDGDVALILDVAGIASVAGVRPVTQTVETEAVGADGARVPVVFCQDGDRVVAVGLDQVDRLEEFSPADVQYASGRPVVRYRGGLLPLVEIAPGALGRTDLVQVVVVHSTASQIGLVGVVVDEVFDIAAAPVVGEGRGTVSVEVLFGERVADVLDAQALAGGGR